MTRRIDGFSRPAWPLCGRELHGRVMDDERDAAREEGRGPLSRNGPGLVSGPEQIFADDGGDDHERTKNHGDKIAVFHGSSER